MISHMFKWHMTVVILCTLSMMEIESATFMVPIEFYETGQMYVSLDGVNISLNSNHMLTMKNRHCTTTISLASPSEEEIATQTGYREGTVLCRPRISYRS
ncbi:unnamed protein product [Schistosoma rodhaini]|uniref:Secreted protein n=1 Tax=Schistosoma rodhaini TaxID=6188 RepID=A0AA85FMZ6_9TREM|nr:unnamed protein product [Schistosoma rodhaini]CAH8543898.1 unnamed protein product [Schistosoma rodhaini]CAH8570799.1 unnamed protein product [Schistosoma rodhaini]